MTTNQLRYWELRWKQHYEHWYLKELHRANVAKEAETHRSNKAEERIKQQELVLKRIELGIQTQKVNVEWAKLQETQKANLVSWAVKAKEIELQQKQVYNQERLTNAQIKMIEKQMDEVKARTDQILSNIKVAEADAAFGIYKDAREQDRKDLDTIIESYKHGWGEKAGYEIEKLFSSKTNVDKFLKDSGLPPIKDSVYDEAFLDFSKITPNEPNQDDVNSNPQEYIKYRAAKEGYDTAMIEKYGPQAKEKIAAKGIEGPVGYNETGDKQVASKSSVIYSPSTHYSGQAEVKNNSSVIH